MSEYGDVVDTITARNATVETLLAKLNDVYRTTSDNELRAFLFEVRCVLESKILDPKMRVVLPLDRSPYNALLAYCQRRGV